MGTCELPATGATSTASLLTVAVLLLGAGLLAVAVGWRRSGPVVLLAVAFAVAIVASPARDVDAAPNCPPAMTTTVPAAAPPIATTATSTTLPATTTSTTTTSTTTTTTTAPAPPPLLTLVDQLTVDEDAGSRTVTITISGPRAEPLTLSYFTSEIDADAPSDFSGTSGLLDVPASAVASETFDVQVPIVDDFTYEPDEAFDVSVSVLSGSVDPASTYTTTVSIVDDDALPIVRVVGGSVLEGGGTFNAVVQLYGSSQDPIALNYTTANGTAVASEDLVVTSGSVVFSSAPASAPNALSQTVTIAVPIVDDFRYEPIEAFALDVTVVSGTVGPTSTTSAMVSIVDDDARPYVRVVGGSVSEGGGTFNAVVQLYGASQNPIALNYTTADGTAVASEDLVATSGSLTFFPAPAPGPNALSQTVIIPIPIIDDQIFNEFNETFTVQVTPTGSTIIDTAASVLGANVTIVDNDFLG